MTDFNRLKVLAERALDCTFDSYVALLASAKPQEILGLIGEVERLEEELSQCASALPGTEYMDPPDGGNVSIPEQIRRMAKDAERYRWLRDRCTRQWDVMCRDIEIVINGDGADECEDLDGIIDAAIEGATQ
ncbi:hypothetical protein PAE2_24 [Pseudomonas phage PAE2]|nr:hypothetical protein PAE2_24 [Pseudomonas phage PAE2]